MSKQITGKGSSHRIHQDQGVDLTHTQLQQPLPQCCVSSREVELLLSCYPNAWTKEHTKKLEK